MSETVILVGGPSDGKHVNIAVGTKAVETVYATPIRFLEHPPRPSWWHPIRRWRWRPPPPPKPPEMIQLTYRPDGTTDAGQRIFRLASPWQPFRGPHADPGCANLYEALVNALYAVHPAIRQDRGIRWAMDLGWYRRIRAIAPHWEDPDGDDPEKWFPKPGDQLMGLPVTVTDDGGTPHLENPRFPAGWPS